MERRAWIVEGSTTLVNETKIANKCNNNQTDKQLCIAGVGPTAGLSTGSVLPADAGLLEVAAPGVELRSSFAEDFRFDFLRFMQVHPGRTQQNSRRGEEMACREPESLRRCRKLRRASRFEPLAEIAPVDRIAADR